MQCFRIHILHIYSNTSITFFIFDDEVCKFIINTFKMSYCNAIKIYKLIQQSEKSLFTDFSGIIV